MDWPEQKKLIETHQSTITSFTANDMTVNESYNQ